MAFRKRWLFLWIPLGIVGLILLALLFINPIVAYGTQTGLDRLKGTSGSFHGLHVTIIHPGYNLYGLKVVEMPASEHKEPIFYADRIEMRWSWREIFKGHLVRRVKIWNPKVVIPMRPGENGKPAQPPLEIARTLESVPSAGLERLEIVGGQITLVDEHHAGQRVWLHDVNARSRT
jgi:hypothetical protein